VIKTLAWDIRLRCQSLRGEALRLSAESGVLLAEVLRDGPSHGAGLREGDIVVGIGENKVQDMKSLVTALSRSTIGDEVTIAFVRTGHDLRNQPQTGREPYAVAPRRR